MPYDESSTSSNEIMWKGNRLEQGSGPGIVPVGTNEVGKHMAGACKTHVGVCKPPQATVGMLPW